MTDDKFSYQNLRVYEDMIRAISLGEEMASCWDSIHAIAGHFARASEGSLVCLAEASRKRQIPARMEAAGHGLGSILECAGCFDISACKSLISQDEARKLVRLLVEIDKMTAKLASVWRSEEEAEH